MNTNDYSDEQLVELVRTKDQEIYKEIVERYQNKIIRYISRLIGNYDDSLDLAQEVFLKAFQALNSFNLEKKFSSWIYRIAHNEAVNYLKKKNRFKLISIDASEFLQNTLKFHHGIEEKIIQDEEIKDMKNKIDKLPIKYKEVLTLRFFEEKSYEEISDILHIPINTVGTLVKRAKERLKVKN